MTHVNWQGWINYSVLGAFCECLCCAWLWKVTFLASNKLYFSTRMLTIAFGGLKIFSFMFYVDINI